MTLPLSLPPSPLALLPQIFFVSPVRLSVRNLARHVTDGKLKAMVAAAARAGIDAGRATPQDVRLYLEAQVGAAVSEGQPEGNPKVESTRDGA